MASAEAKSGERVVPVILHLSDIHRTDDEPVENSEIEQYLVRDLECLQEAGIPKPNLVVVSGDITQRAEVGEYEGVESLVRNVLAHLQLTTRVLVIVPGNHDVHWPTSEKSMMVGSGESAFQKELLVKSGPVSFTFENEERLQERLKNFGEFYFRLKGRKYPELRGEAYTLDDIPEMNLTLVGLSSIDRVHKHHLRGELNQAAIRAVSAHLEKNAVPLGRTNIAVWHHDLDWQRTNAADCLDVASLKLASTAPFHMALCGHTHRPASNDVALLGGYPLPIVAAGSLCAGARQRPESVARSYNIIQLGSDSARVWVRVKPDRSSPWVDHSVFGSVTSRVSHYDVMLRATGRTCSATEQSTCENGGRLSNPFSASNAKSMPVSQVVTDYVWTSLTDDAVSTPQPQIVVGSRGSGKTALLLTLTPSGTTPLESVRKLGVVGLYCPMKLTEVTAFNGKGWMPQEERVEIFGAFLASVWALALLDALESLSAHITSVDAESYLTACLCRGWQCPTANKDFAALRSQIRKFRTQALSAVSEIDGNARAQLMVELRRAPLLRGGPGPLEDVATEIERCAELRGLRWAILFDEVEFLNPWQQRCVYSYLANPTSKTSCKIATLPYAHTRALGAFGSVLVVGDDYSELPLVLNSDDDFHRIAKGLWLSRQRAAGLEPIPLEEAWPDDDYLLVLKEYTKDYCEGREQLEEALIQELPARRQAEARHAKEHDRRQFGNEFWRKYQESFKFRIAKRAKPKRGRVVPLYWGWKQMLKACGNNPRQFLKLAELCWTSYWSGGIRPLRAHEQYDALKTWADSFSRRCATLPHRGAELKAIVDRVASRLYSTLHAPVMKNERLSIQIEHCTQEQAEAIAIGIAYGFLVPRLSDGGRGKGRRYPSENIVMRLGYPVAVANALPLRQGECLRISDLRQLEFSWWTE